MILHGKEMVIIGGGKFLDDVISTMICLATSFCYVHGIAHVWYDPHQAGDGHIIGPGFENNGWMLACTNRLTGDD